MPDLSKIETPINQVRRLTSNTDATLPTRRDTQAPALEVNAAIRRPNNDAAEIIRQTFGLVNDAAQSIGGNIMAQKGRKDAGKGQLDAATGLPSDPNFAKSRAYSVAYQRETGLQQAFSLDERLTTAITDRLNDDQNPATPEDITRIIDDAYHGFVVGLDGKPKDFGSPGASAAVAEQLAKTRARLTAGALDVIKNQTDDHAINALAGNIAMERKQAVASGQVQLVALPASTASVQPGTNPDAVAAGSATPSIRQSFSSPTGKLPVSGRITSPFGHRAAPNAEASTNHDGIDIAAPTGTKVILPAAGTVKRVGHDSRSGNFVVIDHGDGVTTSYAHLSTVTVREGQTVDAGAQVALSGSTGNTTGPHLHYVVRKDNVPVDPRTFKFDAAVTPAGSPGSPQPAEVADRPDPQRAPPVDFEAYMSRLPPTIDRGKAKKSLLSALVTYADENHDPAFLDGLWQSRRADGTPSFNPQEIALIRDERDRLTDKIRVDGERTKQRRYEDNADVLFTAFVNGNPPSPATIQQFVNDGRIAPSMGFSMVDKIQQQQRQDEREARADEREAQARADADTDYALAGLMEARRSGALTNSSFAEDQARFDRGELGTGKRAVARLQQLRAATRQGQAYAEQNPDAQVYAEKIHRLYKPQVTSTGQSIVRQALVGKDGKPVDYSVPILAEFRRLVHEGKPAATAYLDAVGRYGPKDEAHNARSLRIQALQRKAQEGR